MNKDNNNYRLLAVLLIAVVAVISRFAGPTIMGDAANFAPVNAIALFCGALIGRRWLGIIIPLLFVWIGDIVVNYSYYGSIVLFYDGFYWQYASYALIAVIGAGLLQKKQSVLRVLGGGLAASISFYLISNFGVWAGGMYGYTMEGLINCYAMAIPFFRNTLASDMIYVPVLFGSLALVRYYRPDWVLSKQTVQA